MNRGLILVNSHRASLIEAGLGPMRARRGSSAWWPLQADSVVQSPSKHMPAVLDAVEPKMLAPESMRFKATASMVMLKLCAPTTRNSCGMGRQDLGCWAGTAAAGCSEE